MSACLVLVISDEPISDCEDVECAWLEETHCPGVFLPQDPSEGRCCSTCLVTMDGGHSCSSSHPGFQILCKDPYNCQDGVCIEESDKTVP